MRSFTVRGSESPGSKASVVRSSREGGEPIDEIVESGRSPLDSIVRDGARRMLQAALESEVDAFLEEHAVLLDECGRRRVVRNGYLPTREIATGAGILEVSQPRVRDKASIVDERIVFSSKILPPYLRKSRSMEDLIPWLSLKGVSTGDFGEALESLIGPSAKGFSPNVIVRLKERWSGEYDEWSRRDLTGKQYVYIWADGIHVRIRLEDPANPKQCLLVVMGATADGQKELIAVIDGVRESKQSWLELLLDLKNRGLTIPPTIAVADGALGFWAALREAYPTTREQRCSSPQDRQRHQLHAQGDPTKSEVRPPPDLARRDQGDGQKGLRSLPGEVRRQVRGVMRLPGEGSRRAPCLLQSLSGALEPPAHHQSHREHLRDDPTAASPHEGKRLEKSQPRDDVQARRVSGTSLATPQRKPSTHARHPRKNLHRRSPAERRLIHASRTQHLTRAL